MGGSKGTIKSAEIPEKRKGVCLKKKASKTGKRDDNVFPESAKKNLGEERREKGSREAGGSRPFRKRPKFYSEGEFRTWKGEF